MFSNFSMHQNYLVSLLILTLLPHATFWGGSENLHFSILFDSEAGGPQISPLSIYCFKNHTCTSDWLAQEMIQFLIYLNTYSILFFFCSWYKTLSKWIVMYFNLLVIQIHSFFTWKAMGSINYHAGSLLVRRELELVLLMLWM